MATQLFENSGHEEDDDVGVSDRDERGGVNAPVAGPSHSHNHSHPPAGNHELPRPRPRRGPQDRKSQLGELEHRQIEVEGHLVGLANAQLGLGQVAQKLVMANNAGTMAALEEELRRAEEEQRRLEVEERRRRGALASSSSQQGQGPQGQGPGQKQTLSAQQQAQQQALLAQQQAQLVKLQGVIHQQKDLISQIKAQLVVMEAKYQEMKDDNRTLFNQVGLEVVGSLGDDAPSVMLLRCCDCCCYVDAVGIDEGSAPWVGSKVLESKEVKSWKVFRRLLAFSLLFHLPPLPAVP